MEKDKVVLQFRYLRKLRRMPLHKLKRIHKKTFLTSAFAVKIPNWIHRTVYERRLFMLFCLKNYHFPKDHPITKEFRDRARYILSEEYVASITPEQHAEEVLKQGDFFTIENIEKMSIIEVDRYLASASIYVEGTEGQRRKVLYEWFNHPVSNDIAKPGLRRRRKGRLNNNFKLRDLILENRTLCYDDFMLHFAEQMPTVTRQSFNNTRHLLRIAGYDIPQLPKGPYRPLVVKGSYGQPQKARRDYSLSDLPLEVKKHGQEEPF